MAQRTASCGSADNLIALKNLMETLESVDDIVAMAKDFAANFMLAKS